MRKFLQPLLIGELAPEEPSQDGPQNVRRALVEAKPPVGGLEGIASGSFIGIIPRGPGAKAGSAIPSWADSCRQSRRDTRTSVCRATPGKPLPCSGLCSPIYDEDFDELHSRGFPCFSGTPHLLWAAEEPLPPASSPAHTPGWALWSLRPLRPQTHWA